MHRAVRFIRRHSKDYRIDPDRIGIAGVSAGGDLSLMQGTAGDLGNKDANDPRRWPRHHAWDITPAATGIE
jgi:acetyl esterase/lipase